MSDGHAPVATSGWYPDPSNSTRARYWDGAAWTERTAGTVAIGERSDIPSFGNPSPTVSLSAWAVATLVVALAGGFLSPIAILLGIKARRAVDSSHGLRSGRGLATAGMVIGTFELGLLITAIAFMLLPLD